MTCQTCGRPADYHHVRTNRDYCATHMAQRNRREGRRVALAVIGLASAVAFVLAMLIGCASGAQPASGEARPRQGTETPANPHSAT